MKLSKYAIYVSPNSHEEISDNALYNPMLELNKTQRRLPHWEQREKFFFVTFRLADSIPEKVLQQLREEREIWLSLHPKPWDEMVEAEYYKKYDAQLEKFLDEGHGSCILREENICRIVYDTLRHFDEERYELSCFVIMPNHVHVLLKMREGFNLPKILFSWKSFSAHEINKVLGTHGRVWQKESWDRMIRSHTHFNRVFKYILNNPIKRA